MSIRAAFSAVFAVWLCLAPRVQAVGDPALLDSLTQQPRLGAVTLSTDGHFLAALRRKGEGSELVVWHADAGPDAAKLLPYTLEDMGWMAWVGGGRLLLSLKEHGLVLYDAHLKRLRPLIDGPGPRPGELPPVLLSSLPDDPRRILLQWEDPSLPGFPAVFRVDALTGESEKVVSAWNPVVRWWASPEGSVQLGEGFIGRRHLLFTRQLDGSWDPIVNRDYFDDPGLSVLAVETGGATALVLSAHKGDKRSLWRMDIHTGDFVTELASNRRFDIQAAIVEPQTNMAVGAVLEGDGIEDFIWASAHREWVEGMAARAGVGHLALVSASTDGRRQLFRYRPEASPVRYYLYDAEEDRLSALPYDATDDQLPNPATRGVWIRLPKTDLAMHALISRGEAGSPARTSRRGVVLVHGGPVSRATDKYNPLVSWLVANGYSVLQPNFRGSSGFGDNWRRAGFGEWGHDMQDDVRTAISWMIDEGIADKGRICVVGGSYGGYAAQMSAMRDDDLIGCAVSLNGVSSIELLIEFLKERRFHMLTVPRIKENLSSRALRRRSPLNRANLVRVPVLLLHSTLDTNVPYEHSRLMHEMLTQLRREHNFITLEGAGHQLDRPSERRVYYQNMLNFLDAHIGAGYQRAGK